MSIPATWTPNGVFVTTGAVVAAREDARIDSGCNRCEANGLLCVLNSFFGPVEIIEHAGIGGSTYVAAWPELEGIRSGFKGLGMLAMEQVQMRHYQD